MNLHEIIKRNMLRFGTKNLDESAIRLIEQVEPDLSKADWSKGGTIAWENANINSIINYVKTRDAAEDYSKYAIYGPVMEWFRKHDGPDTRESLLIWCGNDPYYGLGDIGEKSKQAGTSDGRQTKQTQQELRDLADRYQQEVINQLKGSSDLDGQFKAALNVIPVALRKTADAGVFIMPDYITRQNSSLTNFIKTKGQPSTDPKTYTFLPNGGYTLKDVNLAKASAKNMINALQINQKGSQVSPEATTQNILADNNARAKMLSDIQTQCFAKLKSPAFQDGIRAGKIIKLDIDTIVKKADVIYFSKEGDISVKGAAKGVSNKEVITSTPEIIKFSYPPNEVSDADHLEMQKNFFGDDGTSLTVDSREAIVQMVDKIKTFIIELQNQYPNETIDVQSMNIFTYAATSTVNSSFGTGPAFKTNKVYNKKNNVTLAAARCKSMASFTERVINEDLGKIISENSTQIIKNPAQLNANVGPEWESVGGSNLGTTFTIANYGPLFQAAYEKNPKLTPKAFYADRANSEQKKSEYEATYSLFRVSKIGIAVQLVMPKSLKDQAVEGEYVVSLAGGFEGGIQWSFWSWPKIKLPNVKLPKVFKNMPTQTMPVFNGRTMKCTF